MPITSVNKTVSPTSIPAGGTAQVTLTVHAASSTVANPVDVALVLDRSGSMSGRPLMRLKEGANQFIRILADNTGTDPDEIEEGSAAGLVSFAATAGIDQALTTSVPALQSAIDALAASGNSNIAAGLSQAQMLFAAGTPGNRRVLVLFSDGKANLGADPIAIADAMKAEGVEIYCIGLAGETGVDENLLKAIASTPEPTHVAIAPSEEQLADLFAHFAQAIAQPGATDIHIYEELNSGLTIVEAGQPSVGQAYADSAHTLMWTIPTLAASGQETATLTFTVQDTGNWVGDIFVNDRITLTDEAGDVVQFPDPILNIYTDPQPEPEPECPDVEVPCPPATVITTCGCQQASCVDVGEVTLEGTARLLCLNMTVRGLCPGTRTALGVLVKALGPCGEDRGCAFKSVILPARNIDPCQPVRVKGIRLVMPAGEGCQAQRAVQRFEVRVFANCIDYACNGICADDGSAGAGASNCSCGSSRQNTCRTRRCGC